MNKHIRMFSPNRQRPHPALVYACEKLETRRLLADLSGMVFHDVNVNGQKDLSEARQQGFQIFVDFNRNGVLDEGEPSAISDGFGNWAIRDVPVGRHIVRQVERPGFAKVPQKPSGGVYFVNVVSEDQVISNLDFGNSRYASALGTVFFDADGDGVFNNDDTPLQGVRVYVDANNNGVRDPGELSKLTNANGEYRIDFIYPGITTIRIETPADLRPSTTDAYRQLFYSNRRSENLNFGLTSTGHLRGMVWHDVNGDGIQQAIEPPLANRLVWLDQNQNGIFDTGEVSVLTDSHGNYAFNDLRPGTYFVAALAPVGTETTVPESGRYQVDLQNNQTIDDLDFGFAQLGRIRGTVYGDDNENGERDSNEQGLAGRRVYLDLNGDGQFQAGEPLFFTNSRGEYLFTDLPSGTYVVRLDLPINQVQTFPNAGQTVDVRAGHIERDNDFGVALAGLIQGQVFNDRNGNGVFDTDDKPLMWRRVYIDANNNGEFDPGEISAVTDANGNYTIGGLRSGRYIVRAVPVPGTIQTVPAAERYIVDARGGVIAAGRNFGFAQRASLRGVVFADTNANGIQDPGESGIGGIRVFIDVNRNGVPDVNEHQVLTNPDGSFTISNFRPGTWRVRIVVPDGQNLSVPDRGFYTAEFLGGEAYTGFRFGLFGPGVISGTVFSDLNFNGIQEIDEPFLAGRTVFLDLNRDGVRNFGEPQDVTDANGFYEFANVTPGSHRVVVRIDDSSEVVTVPVDGFYDLNVTTGSSFPNRNFGIASGTISGLVFNDLNSNGTQDGGEDGLPGITIFIDENSNGQRDPGEPQTVTNASGIYTFSNLEVGTYVVRLAPQPGELVTSPALGQHVVTLNTIEHSANNNFGLFGHDAVGTAAITGLVFNDLDGNGVQDGGESGLDGVVVYIDANNNDTLDPGESSVTTSAGGTYAFTALAAGTYTVRVAPEEDQVVTAPAGGEISVTVADGETSAGNTFGVNFIPLEGTVTGTVYADENGNGSREGGEDGVAGVIVYVDLNSNDVRDIDEPFATTIANGDYTIPNVPFGNRVLRVDTEPDVVVTDPADGEIEVSVLTGQVAAGNVFGINVIGV